jgi:hypothetical protein
MVRDHYRRMASSLTFGKTSLEANRHLTPALERSPATLAGMELRQSRFDHFKVSAQLILPDLAGSIARTPPLLRHLRHVRVLHARQRDLPYTYPYIEASLGYQKFVLGSGYRWRHKGWRYRIHNAAFKNGIDFGLRSRVDVPALDITNRV